MGQENHTAGHAFRFGVWVDGRFAWVSEEHWQRSMDYADHTMVTEVTLRSQDLRLSLTCRDTVDFHENLYLRQVIVHNEADAERQVRLFFGQDFHISGQRIGDSAYYEPERLAILHYKGKRWFLINTAKPDEDDWALGVDQWAVGVKEVQGKEGAWRDAEDGILACNAAQQGSVDSVVALHLAAPPQGDVTGWYWIAVGDCFEEVTRINRAVREKGPPAFLDRTRHYWALWSAREEEDFRDLPERVIELYRRSWIVLRSHIDDGGAILAANDYDVARYYQDTYCYVWPRDAALVVAALIEPGYSEVSERFFEFCHQAITEEGYLLHKFNPDGSLASSWHGWYHDGRKELPVQEDETALVLWALWRYFRRFRTVEVIKPLYRGLIVRAANWMASFVHPATGLPLASWDLWEERRGVHAWTVGATWAGLQAAANFAEAFGEHERAVRYRNVADEMKSGAVTQLWKPDLGRFTRTIDRGEHGGWDPDEVVDSSLFGLWYFGMFPPDDPKIVATMEAIRERLWIKTDVGGIARYESDLYQQIDKDTEKVPGNPWFVCTLWLAQWHIATATALEDLTPARDLLVWTAEHALPSGIMAEQVDPHTGAPLSVSPLTWSHGTLVLAVREYVEKYVRLTQAIA